MLVSKQGVSMYFKCYGWRYVFSQEKEETSTFGQKEQETPKSVGRNNEAEKLDGLVENWRQ